MQELIKLAFHKELSSLSIFADDNNSKGGIVTSPYMCATTYSEYHEKLLIFSSNHKLWTKLQSNNFMYIYRLFDKGFFT